MVPTKAVSLTVEGTRISLSDIEVTSDISSNHVQDTLNIYLLQLVTSLVLPGLF